MVCVPRGSAVGRWPTDKLLGSEADDRRRRWLCGVEEAVDDVEAVSPSWGVVGATVEVLQKARRDHAGLE